MASSESNPNNAMTDVLEQDILSRYLTITSANGAPTAFANDGADNSCYIKLVSGAAANDAGAGTDVALTSADVSTTGMNVIFDISNNAAELKGTVSCVIASLNGDVRGFYICDSNDNELFYGSFAASALTVSAGDTVQFADNDITITLS